MVSLPRDVPLEVKRLALALVDTGDTIADTERVVLDVVGHYADLPGLAAAFVRADRWQGLPPGNRAAMGAYALVREANTIGADADPWRTPEALADLTDIERMVSAEMRAALDALDHVARSARKDHA